jgi:hypothetical protein
MFKNLLLTAAIALTSCSVQASPASAFHWHPDDGAVFAMDMAWCQGFIAREAVVACIYALCPRVDGSACKLPNDWAYRQLPLGRSRHYRFSAGN